MSTSPFTYKLPKNLSAKKSAWNISSKQKNNSIGELPSPIERHPFFLTFVDFLIRRNIFYMKLADLQKRIQKAQKDGHYIEAFLLLSGITESIVVILAVAMEASKKGFDGKKTLFAKSVQDNPEMQKFYKTIIRRDLKENINALKHLNHVDVTAALPKLHTWRDHRNNIFHNFAELMLQDILEKKCEEAYRHLYKISREQWYENMELSFVATQTALPKTKKKRR